jgi:ATP-dependent RNA helicase DeaD
VAAAPFAALGARRRTVEALARMGIEAPTLIQARAIPPLLAGHDVIGQSRTGSGKTIAFGLPLVERIDPRQRRVQALVLVPTRELAAQVAEVLEALDAGRGLRVAQLIGGRSIGPQRDALLAGAQIVVGAPGRVLDLLRQGVLDLGALRVAVLDEADQMLDAGFAPDVERILAATPPNRQMALFTATLPEWTTKIAHKHLREPVRVDAGSPETRPAPAIEQIVYLVPDGCRLAALRALLDRRRDAAGTTLVFGRTKHGVKKLAKQLGAQGYPVAALQGNMSQNARDRVIADFRAGQVPILLATNVAARGLDVLSIEQVINYELPESAELFTHRVGRTGRMERQGEAITLLTSEDVPTWKRMQRELGVSLAPRPWPQRELPLAEPAPVSMVAWQQSAAHLSLGQGDRMPGPQRSGPHAGGLQGVAPRAPAALNGDADTTLLAPNQGERRQSMPSPPLASQRFDRRSASVGRRGWHGRRPNAQGSGPAQGSSR